MATQWQGPHFIVIAAASALAFAAGYTLAGRSRPPAISVPPATNVINGAAPTFPPADMNGQDGARRGRPDENELIARNAEPEESVQSQRQAEQREERGGRDAERRRRPPPDEREDFPQEQPYEEDPGYGPEGA